MAIARTRATMESRPSIKPLSALPFPRITPTAFSARWNDEAAANRESQRSHMQSANIPSSPPLSPVNENADGYANVSSNRLVAEPRTPIQLSSPMASQTEDEPEPATDFMWTRRRPGGLTSSVVKGEAANSLLQLVRGDSARSGGMGMCGL